MESVTTQTHWHYGVTLKQCVSYIVQEYTIPSHVTKLIDVMHMDGHITYRQRQDITQVPITTHQMEQLLTILIRKSDSASFQCLTRVLNDNNRSDIVETINNHMEKVKLMPEPPEENIHEMVERIKLNPMDVPPSEMLRCFTIVAERLTQAGTQEGGATSSGQHHAATDSTKEGGEIPDEAFNRLMKACQSGNTEEVKRLLADHPDYINGTNTNRETPLMVASRHNNVDTVTELLKSAVIRVNMRDINGRTALMNSVVGGGCEVITLLLNTEGVDVNICDNDGLKFHWYMFGMEIVEYLAILPQLLENMKDADKFSPIFELYFIQYFDKIKELQKNIDTCEGIPKVVKCLLENNVNHTGVLMSCLATGTPDLVRMVLESQKSTIDTKEITDYAYAIVSSVNPRVVDVLIECGVINLDRLTSVEIDTLVESVIRYNCPTLCARMTKLVRALPVNEALRTVLVLQATPVDVWFMLDNHKFDFNMKDEAGNSIGGLFCKYGTHEAATEVIQQTDVDFTLRNNHGQTFYMLSLFNCDRNVAKLLFDNEKVKVGVNDVDNFGTSTLDYACLSGNIGAVKTLVGSTMIDINARDSRGMTSLMNVCLQGFSFSVISRFNISKSIGTSEFMRKRNKINRMSSLFHNSNTEVVGILLDSDKIDVNLKSSDGRSVLEVACYGGNATIVGKLIENGVNVNDTGENGLTALMVASMVSTCEIVSLLLRANADINAVMDDGHTLACSAENTDVVRLLLKENASVNTVSIGSVGYTPLHIACFVKNVEIVELLLDAKADIHQTSHNGQTALHIAVALDTSHNEIRNAETEYERAFWVSKLVPNADIVRALLQAKADVNATTSEGTTPLMTACRRENVEIVQILMTAGADVNKTNSLGYTALMASCATGNEAVLKELLSAKNLEINALNDLGFSALAAACVNNFPKAVSLLLEHNADRNWTFHGVSLLEFIEDEGFTEIENLLKNTP